MGERRQNLTSGKTPSGAEIHTVIKHLVRSIRRHWPRSRVTFRGDAHYGRTQAMKLCEANDVDYIVGLSSKRILRCLAYRGRRGFQCAPRRGRRGQDAGSLIASQHRVAHGLLKGPERRQVLYRAPGDETRAVAEAANVGRYGAD